MSSRNAECPECASLVPIEENQLGTPVKCPKCKSVFTAESAGGAYELVDETTSSPVRDDPGPRDADSPRPKRRPAAPPKVNTRPETEEERRLRQRMEKWADEMDKT